MANYSKYTRSAIGHMSKHFERGIGSDGERVKFNNQDIDPGRSHLNYNLAPDHESSQVDFINKRISEVKCLKRADVNVMCSWVVTYPKQRTPRTTKDGVLYTMSEEDMQERFFTTTYNFLEEKYGRENVISSYVHMDENTPHMHFSFIPVVHDEKKNCDKVSAKECVERQDLREFHVELMQYLERETGFSFPVLNQATKDGNKTIHELKTQELKESIKELEIKQRDAVHKVNETYEQFQKNKAGLERLETKTEEVKTEILKEAAEPLYQKISDLEKEVEALKPFKKRAENLEIVVKELMLFVGATITKLPENIKGTFEKVYDSIKSGKTPLSDMANQSKKTKAPESPSEPPKTRNKGYER